MRPTATVRIGIAFDRACQAEALALGDPRALTGIGATGGARAPRGGFPPLRRCVRSAAVNSPVG
jgi:hypothetical protein